MRDYASDTPCIQLKDLREALEEYPDDAWIAFGCADSAAPLAFYRVKNRSARDAAPKDMLVQVELNLHEPHP
jgi:hypothetical protein